MFEKFNHLAFNNPYYYKNKEGFVIEQNLSELLNVYTGPRRIDPIAVIELLNKNYMFADRTIIQGIQRTPWLARPNVMSNDWEYESAPKHSFSDIKEEEIAGTLFKKICSEIKAYIGNRKTVGVLLSGGMDSRMVAGALDFLIKKQEIKGVEVTGLTWGDDGTRDVVYSKRIALRLGWNWKHYKVTAGDLLNNIKETATHGCEYSPIHLHAIPQIRDDNNLDIILAGSYGDSIGRAEYSGINVGSIKPISRKISNIGGFVHNAVFENSKRYISTDVHRYHERFPREKPYMQNELDYQLHYMRRMLNPCMGLLADKTDICQVFTRPDVYGFMWSIDPSRRNDLVYRHMLNEFITKLDDIPWARTGLPFGQIKGTPDSYLKKHHSYDRLVQNDIFEEIVKLVSSEDIRRLNLFNYEAIKLLLSLVRRFPLQSMYYVEKLIWLASLSVMAKVYDLQGVEPVESKQKYFDRSIVVVPSEYFIRKIKNMVVMPKR
ncbi:asparagine synthase-related protein [Desulfogranum mediterraneum]|uniref:asparagine synthase-related protein n=1 Tax=Desulfogranum mediterraneum TaxID=160661 RepID=UPI0004133066|nr:asparagine synthase-related protein [Desulfogranum mediterraneum]